MEGSVNTPKNSMRKKPFHRELELDLDKAKKEDSGWTEIADASSGIQRQQQKEQECVGGIISLPGLNTIGKNNFVQHNQLGTVNNTPNEDVGLNPLDTIVTTQKLCPLLQARERGLP